MILSDKWKVEVFKEGSSYGLRLKCKTQRFELDFETPERMSKSEIDYRAMTIAIFLHADTDGLRILIP